jgi:hypothetical protein
MIDCAHYRRSILADPQNSSPELLEHRATCHDCAQYTERLLRFESLLARAVRVHVPADVPVDLTTVADAVPALDVQSRDSAAIDGMSRDSAALGDRVVPLRRRSATEPGRSRVYRKGWVAMAASVLLAVVVAGTLWLAVPGPSLAADVVKHMADEPGAWRTTNVPVPEPALQAVLQNSHLRLTAGAGMVSYASSCAFRGHHVPHLVVQTTAGPITVMVLAHEPATQAVQFDEQGYRGVIVPLAGHGSLAVLSHGGTVDMKSVERIAAQVRDSIQWTG